MKSTKQLFAITMVMVFAVAVAFASLPMAKSQLLQYRPQFIFVSAAPDPVGVGQTVYIVYWASEMPMPCDDDPKLGAPGGRECWTGVTLTITKPDGNKITVNMPPSDPVGGGYYILTPDQVGKWSVQAHIPGQWKNRTKPITTYGPSQWQVYPAGSYYFQPADSSIAYFTVQAEPLKTWPEAELPTSYWTRPINAGLREWSQIAGNWLADGRGNPIPLDLKPAI